MNNLQRRQLQLFRSFTEVCEKLGLQYFLVCGSALGSVKYGGFIPWDDDLDIGMLRPDYERFIAEAQDLLPGHVFLQNAATDPLFPQIFTKLRDTGTTYIERTIADIDMVHSVYIDIFPLDGYPVSPGKAKRFEIRKSLDSILRACLFHYPHAKPVTKCFLSFLRAIGGRKLAYRCLRDISEQCRKQSLDESRVICNYGNWQGKREYAPKEQYGNGAYAEFEGIRVRVPENADAYLTQKYGDWRADLPPEQQIGHHYAAIIDTDRPYTDYIVKTGRGKIRLKTPEELLRDGITPPPDSRD